MAPAAGGRDGLIARFVNVVDERQGSPRFGWAVPQGADLAVLLSAYARAVGERSKCRGGNPGQRKSLAA